MAGERVSCFLRVARRGRRNFLFGVTQKPVPGPLLDGRGNSLSTVGIKLNLLLPEGAFGPDAEVTVEVPAGMLRVQATPEASALPGDPDEPF